MATTETGLFLTQFVEPQLLQDFRNFKDDFISKLKAPNKAAIDKDGIRFNKLINNVGYFVNKSTGFTPKKMSGSRTFVEWDKMDTEPTSTTDAELRAMAFDKKSAIREEHSKSFKIGIRDYVLHKLAPASNTANTPVIRTTGSATTANGVSRNRLSYNDLITLHTRLEQLNLTDNSGWNLVLCDEHRADLLVDRGTTNNYRDIEIDRSTGELKRFFKFNLFENNDCPIYNEAGNLKSAGALKAAKDQKASIFFYTPNTVHHIESVKVLAKPMDQDTRNADPTAEIRLHAYGLCDKVQNHGFSAIISKNP